ncbi:adenylate kinase [Halonotius terrestris]|uniref:Putative adenylate kinase n=1 Tax=Halonotius terrestris TaxID=2487750 RepID=A0A8J8TCD7_9EURY|nr:adenylate kinase family protein [Halonotius terrestris]TQQ80014.1 adenylate kinase [Halonotius terrestris]
MTDGVAPKLAVTGTPGTGKTTATEHLADDADGTDGDADAAVIHLNDEIREHDLYSERDADRDSLVTDLDAAREHLGAWTGILESHLAHHFDADRVVVLRCEPSVLEQRLRDRGDSAEKARENAESEALDVVLSEAVEQHGPETVYEIDTTDRDPDAVAGEIAAVRNGDREPSAGAVDFTEYLVG